MATQPGPTVYTVLSRDSVRIPATALLVDGLLSIDPSVQSQKYFTLHFRGAELELITGGFCGYVPINAACALDIRPKMPVQSLNRIFDVASLTFERIIGGSRPYELSRESSGPVLEFLAGELAGALRALVARGLRKKYERRGRSDSRPQGRIDFTRTLRDNIARGKRHRLHTISFQHLLDIPENRVIRAAGELIVRQLRVQRFVNRALVSDLGGLLSYFSAAGRMVPADFHAVSAMELSGANEAQREYDVVLSLALMILREQSAVVERAGGEIELAAVVVNFDELFEAYLRNVLRLERARRSLAFSVLDGNNEGKKGLFDGRSQPPAKPDIVIRAPDRTTSLLVEVKYKSAPDRGDYNQAITYCASYRVNRIVIAHQATRPDDAGLREIGSVGHIRLFGYGILLDATDLEQQEAAFATAMFSLATEVQ
jgi:5-methylcytosine-specific restriction enzyme subunit McrC